MWSLSQNGGKVVAWRSPELWVAATDELIEVAVEDPCSGLEHKVGTARRPAHRLWVLSHAYAFEGDRLARAIRATFERRRTEIPPSPPDALRPAFADDPMKRQQWASYVEDLESSGLDLSQVIADLVAFLMPHAEQARSLP